MKQGLSIYWAASREPSWQFPAERNEIKTQLDVNEDELRKLWT